MNNKKLFLASFSLITIVVFVFTACDKKVGKTPVIAAPSQNECDTITYTKHIKPIIDANCVSCHGATSPSAGLPLVDYTEVKSAADLGKIKARVVDGNPSFMPQGGQLPPGQIKLINCWLGNGKKQ